MSTTVGSHSALTRPHNGKAPFNLQLIIGAVIIGVLLVTAIVGSFWTPYDPTVTDTSIILIGPNATHLLGTDALGRDLLSLVVVGSIDALVTGLFSAIIGMTFGVILGSLTTSRGKTTSEIAMRGADLLYALPAILLALVLAASLGPGQLVAILAIGVSYIPPTMRLTRASSLAVLSQPYSRIALTYGCSPTHIFIHHVIPNIGHVLTVQCSIIFSFSILIGAALSYLGLGTQPPTPSWGRTLQEAQAYVVQDPLFALWPGLAIVFSVVGFNLLGDGFHRFFDPRAEI